MNCDEALIAISAYLDNELSKTESEELEAHLAECETCRQIYAELRGAEEAFCDAQEDVPATFHESVMARIRQEKQKKNKQPLRIFWAVAAAAAVIAVMLASGVLNLRDLAAPDAAVSLHGAVQTVKTDYQALADELKQPILVLKKMPQELADTAAETLAESGETCWRISAEDAGTLYETYGGTVYAPADGTNSVETLVIVTK